MTARRLTPPPASCALTPLDDLGTGNYLGFLGGLYPSGSNALPAAHAAEGAVRAGMIAALDTAGNPSVSGKYVMVSIGMSNTTQEFCSQNGLEPCNAWTFRGQVAADSAVNTTTLAIVNGAKGGQTAAAWDSATDTMYNEVRDLRLAPRGLSEAQVQIGWVKVANAGPSNSLPAANADAYLLEASIGNIWFAGDFEGDGTHPAQSGEQKVGALLLAFFKTSPQTSCWFLAGQTCP